MQQTQTKILKLVDKNACLSEYAYFLCPYKIADVQNGINQILKSNYQICDKYGDLVWGCVDILIKLLIDEFPLLQRVYFEEDEWLEV